jgi:hypothetical protein
MRALVLLAALPALAGAADPPAPDLPPPPPPPAVAATPAGAALPAPPVPGELLPPPPLPGDEVGVDPGTSPAAPVGAPARSRAGEGFGPFGLRFGVGVPDGLVAAFTYRPDRRVRLSAGPAWNWIAWGLQGGATVAPFTWAVTPTLGVDYGHYFSADLSRFQSDSAEMEQLLSDVRYDYVSVHLGLETGSQRSFAWYLRGGLSWVWARGGDEVRSTGTDGTVTTLRDAKVNLSIPTVSTGITVWF